MPTSADPFAEFQQPATQQAGSDPFAEFQAPAATPPTADATPVGLRDRLHGLIETAKSNLKKNTQPLTPTGGLIHDYVAAPLVGVGNRVAQNIVAPALDMAEDVVDPAEDVQKRRMAEGEATMDALVDPNNKRSGASIAGEMMGNAIPLLPGAGTQVRGYANSEHPIEDIAGDLATAGLIAGAGKSVGGTTPEEAKTPGALKRIAQKVAIGDRPAAKLVKGTIETNAKETERAVREGAENQVKNLRIKKLNEDRVRAHADAVKKAADANREAVAGHQEKVAAHVAATDKAAAEHVQAVADQAKDVQQAADTERVRQQTADEHEKLSGEYVQDIENAKKKAQADVDEAWKPIHEAAGSEKEPIADLQAIAKRAGETADPVVLPIVKSLLGEGAVTFDEGGRPIVNGETRKVIAGGKEVPLSDQNYAHYYEFQYGELPPVAEEGGTATFDRLHRLYSYIGNALYSGARLEPGRYRALKMLQHGVDTAMQNIAERTGQTANLANARRLSTEKFETFNDSPNEPATNASKSVGETTGDYQKEQQRRARLDMLSRYDKNLPAKAERIRSLQRTLDELPTQRQTAATNKPEPEAPELKPKPKMGKLKELPQAKEPLPLKPEKVEPNIQQVGPDEIRKAKLGELEKSIDWIHHRGKWFASGMVFTGILYEGLHGHFTAMAESIGMAGAVLAAADKLGTFLEKPEVQHWLTEPTPRDLAQLNNLPPEQRAVIAEGFRPAIEEARQKGIKVNPALLALLGSITTTPKTAGEAKKQAQANRTYTQNAVSPSGHRIGSNDGTNWFDIETGQRVQ